MSKTSKDCLLLTFLMLLVTALIWFPHLLRLSNFYGLDFSSGFNTIYRNFDGLEYIVIAKTLYFPKALALIPQSLQAQYYASHFPLYSLFILIASPILGFLKSMLFVSLLSTIGSTITFYFLVKDFKLTSHPLFLSFLFLILPARWLIVHSIGSSEPTFIFFVILSLYFFMKYEQGIYTVLHLKNPPKNSRFLIYSAFAALGAQLTRPPGILLFISFMLYIHWNHFIKPNFKKFSEHSKNHLKYWPLLIVPLGLLGIFFWYQNSMGDFWAYFHSGDNIHLTFPPFQVFNKNQFWVGEIWLEDIIYIFILGFLGGVYLFKQKLYPMAFFVLTYLTATTLIAHRDIARYSLPVFPFLLIAFERVLISKEFKVVLIIVALAIFLYSQNFILSNTAPIPNLSAFN